MRLIALMVLMLTMTGCISTYRGFSPDAIDRKQTAGNCDVMYYNVKKFDILESGGYNKLQTFFRNAAICKTMKPADEPPAKGLYLDVEAKWKPMSMSSVIFGYISVSTLTMIPAWSTQDGYDVRYSLYRNGVKKETYNYDITRKAGLWVGLLPFAWINAFTYSEEDAFQATSNQFWTDAQPYFVGGAR